MAEGVTEFIVRRCRGLRADALPPDVLEVARQSILDWFGVAITGASEPLVDTLLAEVRRHGGNTACSVVGHADRTSPAWAALVNGAGADAADFSDANLTIHGHPTAAVMAAALAVAEERNASGSDLLAAVVAGVELECRVGRLIQPEAYERTGFHPTGPVVHFGAAAAAAHLMGLSEAHWGYAMGIAATQAAGLKASAGTMAKPSHCGFAAMHGVMAAGLAASGFVSNPRAIEADGGFAETHSPAFHEAELRAEGERFYILETRVKRHATCALTHSTIENMIKLRGQQGIKAGEVKRIDLDVPVGHLHVVGKPRPRTPLEAKFSLWATSAMALMGDDTSDLNAFEQERIDRPALRALMERVHVVERPGQEFSVGVATVELADGRRVSATSDTSQPVRDLVLRRQQVTGKFRALAVPVLGSVRAAQLERAVLEIETHRDLRPLVSLVVK